jgi:hypothetical protein
VVNQENFAVVNVEDLGWHYINLYSGEILSAEAQKQKYGYLPTLPPTTPQSQNKLVSRRDRTSARVKRRDKPRSSGFGGSAGN